MRFNRQVRKIIRTDNRSLLVLLLPGKKAKRRWQSISNDASKKPWFSRSALNQTTDRQFTKTLEVNIPRYELFLYSLQRIENDGNMAWCVEFKVWSTKLSNYWFGIFHVYSTIYVDNLSRLAIFVDGILWGKISLDENGREIGKFNGSFLWRQRQEHSRARRQRVFAWIRRKLKNSCLSLQMWSEQAQRYIERCHRFNKNVIF